MLSDLDTSSPDAVLKLFPLNVQGQTQIWAKTQHVLREKTQLSLAVAALELCLLCNQVGLSLIEIEKQCAKLAVDRNYAACLSFEIVSKFWKYNHYICL